MPVLTTGAGAYPAISGGGGPTYTRSSASSGAPSSGGLTFTADIGTASSTRVVLVGTVVNSSTTTAVTINGVAATNIFSSTTTSFWALIGAAAGSGVQTIITTGPAFVAQASRVWYMDGLNSTTLKNSATGSAGGTTATININITSGDLLFAIGREATSSVDTVDFSTSTNAQANQSTVLANSTFNFTDPDWTTSTTNASWAITGTHTVAAVLLVLAVSFR